MTPDFTCSACEEGFFDRSEMPLLSPCPNCGEDGTVSLDLEDPEPTESPSRSTLDPRAEARSAADALLTELGIDVPPIDVVAIARKLGLKVEYVTLGNVSGELRNGRIRVNKDHHRVRQRFSIAHELGHVRLHTSHGTRGTLAERQADTFAGALLVPPSMLRAAVADDPDFDRLRHRFDISRDVLTIALEQARLTGRLSSF
jgi:uncharacterized protein DUF955